MAHLPLKRGVNQAHTFFPILAMMIAVMKVVNLKKTLTKFIYENIITRFGYAKDIVSDQRKHFVNHTIMTKHEISSPYHPQATSAIEAMIKS